MWRSSVDCAHKKSRIYVEEDKCYWNLDPVPIAPPVNHRHLLYITDNNNGPAPVVVTSGYQAPRPWTEDEPTPH